MAESPYRSAPYALLCPRCGDVFEDAFAGASSCVRCGGLWIGQPTIDRAFGDPLWPPGANAWWRRELRCPVCTSEGKHEVMSAILVDNIVVDRCRGHGVWLDDGELGRVLDTDGNGLPELYARVYGEGAQADMLRKLSGAELAHKRQQATESKAWIDRIMSEARVAAADVRKRRGSLDAARTTAKRNVERLEASLVRAREDVRACENELAAARALLQELENETPST